MQDFKSSLELCRRGFNKWASQPHNAKWAYQMRGTPIENDLLVYIAEEFCHDGRDTAEAKS